MSTELATRNGGAMSNVSMEAIEEVLVGGNLGVLTAEQRVTYYKGLCDSLELNPLSRPFDYLNLKGKIVLYAKKDCTEQLRRQRGVSIYQLDKERQGSLYVVTAYARDKFGREDSDMGAVELGNLKGEDLANAMMKAITKAKRRVTLSICGLAMPDESEIETIPHSAPAIVREDGVIVDRGQIEYNENARNSDPPRDAMKHETLDGRLIHPPTIDPATQRPFVQPLRNEANEPLPADASFGPIGTDTAEDIARHAALRKGLGSHKGWLVNKALDPDDRELSLYLLNRAALGDSEEGRSDGWTSRKQLTGEDWTRCNATLAKLTSTDLAEWITDFSKIDPFADDDEEASQTLLEVPAAAAPRRGHGDS